MKEQNYPYGLKPRNTPGARIVKQSSQAFRLEIPPGPAGKYRLAQLDDYTFLTRRRFPWRPPLAIELRVRSSANHIHGTWGFGLWNDPFSISLGLGGGSRRLPALPNTIWFFFASPANYLSLTDHLPGNGMLAATFMTPAVPAPVLTAFPMALPLLLHPRPARLLRDLGSKLIQQDSTLIDHNPADWHNYKFDWQRHEASFYVEQSLIYSTRIVPRPPLGLVIWIDNQYAAFPPDGRLSYGTLASQATEWIEISDLKITTGSENDPKSQFR